MPSPRFQRYFFAALSLIVVVLLFMLFRPYLGLFVFATVLSILARPIYDFLHRICRNDTAAASLTVLLVFTVVLLPLAFISVTLVREIIEVFNHARYEVSYSDIQTTLSHLVGPDIAQRIADQVQVALAGIANDARPVFSAVSSNILNLFSNTLGVVFDIVLVLLGTYYLLKDGPALKRALFDFSPLERTDDVMIVDRVREAVRGVAIGSLSVAIVKGLVGGAVFWALGIQAPVFWGTMIALAHYLPVVGTAVVTAPFAIYLFATGHFWQGLVLSLASVLVVGLIDNILGPYIIKTRLNVHPMLILLSILGGIAVFGASGAFFGPIVLAVSSALYDIYRKEFDGRLAKSDSVK